MTWREVARKDLHDAIRARWLWILSVLMILAFTAPIVYEEYLDIGRLLVAEYTDNTTQILVTYSRAIGAIVVPVLGLVMSYAAITRERDSGSIKVLLSLPHARRDIVLGKFVGRSAAVLVPVAVAMLVALALLAGAGGLAVRPFAVFVLANFLLVVAITGIGVGLSAHMDTTRRAILASITALVLFLPLWTPITGSLVGGLQGLVSLFGTTLAQTTTYSMENVALLANPVEAYKDLLAPYSVRGSVAQQYPAEGPAPIYLRAPFSVFVMALWTVGSLLVGTRHFERIDL